MGGQARAEQHQAALDAGTWVNPADAPGAREKLSRPRVHTDNPDLHRAMEKLSQGLGMAELTNAEAETYRAYRRESRAANPGRAREHSRRSYRRRMASEEGRARERRKWERQRQRLEARLPNAGVRVARERVGLSQSALAGLVGVSQSTVSKWERSGVVPRAAGVRAKVAEMLGCWVWPGDDQQVTE
jgi:DNA-binding transcriptional regulator YiaG